MPRWKEQRGSGLVCALPPPLPALAALGAQLLPAVFLSPCSADSPR